MNVMVDRILYDVSNPDFAILISVLDKQQDVYIPETITGKPVTQIAKYAFQGNSVLHTICLPNSISIIDESAFLNCESLENVSFYPTKNQARMLNIRKNAFARCRKLTMLLTKLEFQINCESQAFSKCISLEVIHGQLNILQGKCFEQCVLLDNLFFAENALWRTDSFQGCDSLMHLTFYGDVEESLSNTCMKWLINKKVKCPRNSSLVGLVHFGANVTVV